MKYYKKTACNQNTKADPKMNLIFTFPLQEVFPFKKFLFTEPLKNFLCMKHCTFLWSWRQFFIMHN